MENCQVINWKEYSPGLPEIIDIDSVNKLPYKFRFSVKKILDMDWDFVKISKKLEFSTLFHWSDTWQSEEDLEKLMNYPENTAYVQEHWKSDEFFGYQLLNGLNPMLIERCTELPQKFRVTNEMVNKSFPESSLEREMKNGNIFLCNYERLSGFRGNVIDYEQQFLSAPFCLLHLTNERKLLPIAIQLKQEPSLSNPIFLPSDSEWDWLLAKIFVRNAEFNEHELHFHLLRTHLLSEVFTVALLRTLPQAHPLYKLLFPHTRYTLQLNIQARNTLISKDGIFSKYTAIGYGTDIQKFMQRAMSSLTYTSLCLPDDISARRLNDIPNFYYREDGQRLWDIIQRFVGGVLTYYYTCNDDVKQDTELQNWIGEIFKHGFKESDSSGIPKSFSKIEELVKFVTMVIFTASAQHAAVNNGQFDFGGWMPNFPSTLRKPPPSQKGIATEKSIFETLPNVSTTINGLTVLHVLSNQSSDRRRLGEYPEELFTDEKPRELIEEFKTDLKKLGQEIEKRNQSLAFPYVYLSPENVNNSVDL
ncbi:polyunsaturated fatty acid lipoxygenase ALOX15B-like [Hoplias malabaricus]|uniref:polyunsaturated fatty acid lipoxygenase ALOX15B-like n=1 Tax=Hoplias malabaricus TaxID=27720 RepID=UPI0034628CA7